MACKNNKHCGYNRKQQCKVIARDDFLRIAICDYCLGKAAEALGLTVPDRLMLADEVIK
jgi:hypothetical protein